MSAELDKLIVTIEAELDKYEKQLHQAKGMTTRATDQIDAAVAKAGQSWDRISGKVKLYGAIATAAAAAATTAIVKSSLTSIDALAKTADKVGVTTEALSGMRHAAELSGAGANVMDKALTKIAMRSAEAAKGVGESAAVFESLNLDAKELAAMAPDQAFIKVAGAMGKVENRSEKVRIAFKLFEEEGTALLNTMDMGTEGIAAAVEEANRLGLAVNRIDAAKVEAANDAMTRAQGAISGIGNTITVALAPYIEAVATKFAESAKEAGGWKTEILSGTKVAITGAARVGDAWRGLELIWEGLKVAWEGLNLLFLKGLESLDQAITDTVNGAIGTINELIEGINKIPGVELPTLDKVNYDAVLAEMVTEAEGAFDRADAKWMEMAARPLPSDSVKAWLAEVEAAATVAAEAIAAVKPGGANAPEQGGAAGGGDEDPETAAKREKLAAGLLMLEENLMAEEERLFASTVRRAEMVLAAADEEIINEARKKELLEKLEADHVDKLNKIREKGLTKIEKFNAKSWTNQVSDVIGSLVQITQGTAQHNKTMFRINKMAAIANAVVNTALGISKTLGAYPMPYAAILAAAHAAAGIAQVSAISSTSFEGGGGAVAPSVAATGATQVVQEAEQMGKEKATQTEGVTFNLTVNGSIVDHDQFARETFDAFKRAANDGMDRR